MARYEPFYFEDFPIERLHRPSMDLHVFDGLQTGGMTPERFLALKDDIRKNGLLNPIIVEVQQGFPTKFQIAMGYNRTEAWSQLGHDTIKAVVITRDHAKLGDIVAPAEKIPQHEFERYMSQVHPGDDLWKKSVWADRILKSVVQV